MMMCEDLDLHQEDKWQFTDDQARVQSNCPLTDPINPCYYLDTSFEPDPFRTIITVIWDLVDRQILKVILNLHTSRKASLCPWQS
jgi:hypothetical protein